METGTRSKFAEAARYEPQLNARQREVLRLIVDGYTNAQIAERCDITLDGAKWNVSEILTKLGLDSREEAADYWRWRSGLGRRLTAPLRAVMGLSTFKLVAGGGLAAVAVGAIAVAWVATNSFGLASSGSSNQNDRAFVMDVTISFTQPSPVDAVSPSGSNGSGPTTAARPPGEHYQSQLTWTYQDPTHYRYDTRNELPAFESNQIVIAADGAELSYWDAASNTVRRGSLPTLPKEFKDPANLLNPMLGPSKFRSIDALMASLTNPSSSPPSRAAVVGGDKVLGIPCKVIEYGPASSATASAATTQLCVDPVRMIGLRMTQGPKGAPTYDAEVTRLDYGVKVPDSAVAFMPPAGATVAAISTPPDGNNGPSAVPLLNGPPSGFLRANPIPDGYRQSSGGPYISGLFGTGPLAGFSMTYANVAGTAHLTVEERLRTDGLPSALKTGQKVTVNGDDAWEAMDGANRTLVFEQHGVSVLLTADALSYSELEAVAASMTLVK